MRVGSRDEGVRISSACEILCDAVIVRAIRVRVWCEACERASGARGSKGSCEPSTGLVVCRSCVCSSCEARSKTRVWCAKRCCARLEGFASLPESRRR